MTNFYEELRESRLARGLSIEDISSVTKINPQYLHAIESGEYDLLPDPYIVLFIKAYAKEIGIDPDDTARRYRLFRSAEELPKEKRRARRELAEGEQNGDSEEKPKKKSVTLLFGGAAIFILLLLSVKFCSIEESSTGKTNGGESTALENGSVDPAIIDTSIATTAIDSDSAVNFEDDNEFTPLMSLRIISMDSLRVRVVVKTDGEVTDADDITFQRLGEEHTWEGYEQFSLRISKTRSVAIYLDDQLLPFLGPENTWVSKALIDRNGIVEGRTILRARN
ncbi:MAG: helix-turn-helix domain-containing protein [Candidatus Marinimicrobia bacterium]|nr:helix-turn-helix domain-containing protein [Candidatus Neomarinimicrobiota bacterium]